jgi:TonB family protein
MSHSKLLGTILLAAATAAWGQTSGPTPAQTAHYPQVIHAELPLYPPLAWAAHISGTVEIQVTVENGSVVAAQVKSSSTKNQLLSLRSLENVKTWQFESEDRATFVVAYLYKVEGKQTARPENPRVELDLPLLVKITARPFKPTCSDCGADISGTPIR